MNFNLSYSFPVVFILFLLVCFYRSKPRVLIQQNRYFYRLLSVNMWLIMAEFVISCLMKRYGAVGVTGYYLLYFASYCLFLFRSYLIFGYTVSMREASKYIEEKKYHRMTCALTGMFLLLVFSSYWTHALFYVDAAGYHRGMFFWLVYAQLFGYLGLSALPILSERDRIEKGDYLSSWLYVSLIGVGSLLSLLSHDDSILNMFFTFAILVIYLAFENPDYFINKRAGIFNTNAFVKKVNEEKVNGSSLHAIAFAVKNYSVIRASYQAETTDEGLHEIGKLISKISPSSFYLRNGLYFILLDEETDIDALERELVQVFAKPWLFKLAEISFDVEFIRFEPNIAYRNAQQLLDAMHLALDDTTFLNTGEDIVIDDSTIQKLTRKSMVQQSLLEHLELDDLTIVYQPIVKAKTKEVIGAEALARIYDEKLGEIKPSEFIPIAESNGKIGQLTVQVMKRVLRFASAGGLEKNGFEWVNVNLSPLNCLNKNLPEILTDLAAEAGVDPKVIHLEITEEAMIDPAVLESQVNTLREKGFEFVLDDYGSGYANQSRAMRYPFTNIKLDMDMIQDYFDSYNSLLPATITMFRKNGFSITAEGIENEDMVKRLTHLGADYLQGYYFSRPLQEADLLQWTSTYQKQGEEMAV